MRKYSNFSLPRRVIEQIDANVESVKAANNIMTRMSLYKKRQTQYDRSEEVESCMRGFMDVIAPLYADMEKVTEEIYNKYHDMTRAPKETEKIQYHVDELLSDTFKARAKELCVKYSTALILGLCAK